MEVDKATEKSGGGHRPLPSVDMALLPEQRRAARNRWLVLGGGAVILAAGGVASAVVMGPGDDDGTEEQPPEAAAAPTSVEADDEHGDDEAAASAPEDQASETESASVTAPSSEQPHALGAESRVEHRFGKARGFRDALVRAGFDREDQQEIEDALTNVLDFRRCRPEDRMIAERDGNGTLLVFEYHGGSATSYARAMRNERGDLVGGQVEIPVDRIRIARGGTVQTSIGDALESMGLGRALVGRFVSVWEGKVNFSRHTRRGDSFKIIVDEERIEGDFLRWGTVHAVEYVGERTGTLRAFYWEPVAGEGDYFDETGRAIQGGWLRAPLRYDHVSSRFNPRRMHPILRRVVPHNGVDYAAGTGAPVWAAAHGTVTFAGVRGANGNLVSIRHADGYETHYAHLSRIERGMEPGTNVRQRQVIGYVGSTGRSTGPHLHFGLKRNGRFVDPVEAMDGPGRMMPAAALPRFRAAVRRLAPELDQIRVPGAVVGGTPGARAAAQEPAVEDEDVPMD
jgi:murein DD-endopeptidase MepM/ murein hydrolase activator NlpD